MAYFVANRSLKARLTMAESYFFGGITPDGSPLIENPGKPEICYSVELPQPEDRR